MNSRILLPLSILFWASTSAIAQLDFKDPVYYKGFLEPASFELGDFDGDHLMDMAFTTVTNSQVKIIFREADGSFSKIFTFDVGDAVTSSGYSTKISVGDFNQDGKSDIVAFNSYQNSTRKIFTLLSKGRDFEAPRVIETDIMLQGLGIDKGDINGDGKLDFMVGFQDNLNEFYAYLGDGSGGFTLKKIPNQVLLVENLKLRDLNNDNILDLIIHNRFTAAVEIFLGDGVGNFAHKTSLIASDVVFNITINDFSEDNVPDIILTAANKSALDYFIGDGTGAFSKHTIPIDNSVQGMYGVSDFDYNGDGRNDFVMSGYHNGDGMVIFTNSGNNQFTQEYQSTNTSGITYILQCVDLGSGNFEIMTAMSEREILIRRKDVNNEFPFVKSLTYGIQPVNGAAGDLNQDGLNDIICSNGIGNNISIQLNLGDGKFSDPVFYYTSASPNEVQLHDFNADGYPDIIYSTRSNTNNEVGLILSDVAGNLTIRKSISGPRGPFAVADFNKDTYLDVFTDNGLYSGDSQGNFSSSPPYLSSEVMDIRSADFDNDGNADVFATTTTNQATFLYGDGTGSFPDTQSFQFTAGGTYTHISDLNNDGLADIITTDPNHNSISVLTNGGNKTWSEKTFAVGQYPQSVVASDLNYDNIPDLIVGNFNSSSISVLLGKGQMDFTTFKTIAIDGTSSAVKAIDLDNDHLTDLISFNPNGSAIAMIYSDYVTEPSIASTSLVFSDKTEKSISYSFTKGNGKGELVIVSEAAASNQLPTDNFFYAANESFGAGFALGNSYVIKRNDLASGQISTLKPGTKYYVSVFEYSVNARSTIINYLTSSVLSDTFRTKSLQTISFVSPGSKTIGDTDFGIVATSTSKLPVTLDLVSGNITLTGGNITILGPGPVHIKATQAGDDNFIASDLDIFFCVLPLQPAVKVSETSTNKYLLTSSSKTNNQWLLNDEAIPNANDSTYVPDSNGIFAVKVDYDGCSNTSLPTDFLITAIAEADVFQFYPNPAVNEIIVRGSCLNSFADAVCYSSNGQEIKIPYHYDSESLTLNVSGMAPGIYVVQLRTNKKVYTEKFLKR